jgi:integrase
MQLVPWALEPDDVAVFLSDLLTHRDRAIVLAMLLGGLRAGDVRWLRLADVGFGRRMLAVVVGMYGIRFHRPVTAGCSLRLVAKLVDRRPKGNRGLLTYRWTGEADGQVARRGRGDVPTRARFLPHASDVIGRPLVSTRSSSYKPVTA